MKKEYYKIKKALMLAGLFIISYTGIGQSFQYTGGGNFIDELKRVRRINNDLYYLGTHQVAGYNHIQVFKTNINGAAQWNVSIQDTVSETGVDLEVTKSKFLLAGGNSRKIVGSNNLCDALLAKIDQNGNVIWHKTYSVGSFETILTNVVVTNTNGIAFTGGYYDLSNNYKPFLCVTDSNGVVIWCKDYDCATSINISSLEQTANGNYLLTGNAALGFQMIDAVAMRISGTGNIVWSNYYNYDQFGMQNSELIYAKELSGGDLLMVGNSDYQGNGGMDILACRTNSNGAIIFNNFYGTSQTEWPYGVDYDGASGQLYIGGDASGFGNVAQTDATLSRIDSNGVFISTRVIGDTSINMNNERLAGINVSGNDIVACGNMVDQTFNVDYYFVKYNKLLSGCDNYTVSMSTVNYAGTVQPAVITVNTATMNITGRTHTITSGLATNSICVMTPTPTAIQNVHLSQSEIKVFPNPCNTQLSIRNARGGDYFIFNIIGAVVEAGVIEQEEYSIDTKKLSAGLYFIRIDNTVIKFIKE